MRVALVGLGFIAGEHLAAYEMLKGEGRDVHLCAVCDKDVRRLQPLGEAGMPVYTDMEEMLDKERPDMVDVCVPTFMHREVCEQAMGHGCAVLCEKPMALSPVECASMLETARDQGTKLMVAHPMRFFTPYQVIAQYLREGTFGEIRSAFFSRCDGRPGRPGSWLLNSKLSGGIALDLLIHDVDAAQWLFGEPRAVSAVTSALPGEDFYDTISASLIYDHLYVNLYADWSVEQNLHMKRFFRVNFERGYLLFDGDKKILSAVSEGKVKQEYLCGEENFYYNEISYFIDCVQRDLEVARCTLSESMKAVETCIDIAMSVENRSYINHEKRQQA